MSRRRLCGSRQPARRREPARGGYPPRRCGHSLAPRWVENDVSGPPHGLHGCWSPPWQLQASPGGNGGAGGGDYTATASPRPSRTASAWTRHRWVGAALPLADSPALTDTVRGGCRSPHEGRRLRNRALRAPRLRPAARVSWRRALRRGCERSAPVRQTDRARRGWQCECVRAPARRAARSAESGA